MNKFTLPEAVIGTTTTESKDKKKVVKPLKVADLQKKRPIVNI